MTGKTGSARYMAPEVALSLPYNEKADVRRTPRGTCASMHLRHPALHSGLRAPPCARCLSLKCGLDNLVVRSCDCQVHSFAMILYQLLSHEKPFSGMDLEMLYTDVIYGGQRPKVPRQWPASMRDLLRDCWHPDPDCRPPFCAVLRRIERALAESGEGAR
eukprot:2632356-Prymnesium_polylepis.2